MRYEESSEMDSRELQERISVLENKLQQVKLQADADMQQRIAFLRLLAKGAKL